MLAKAVKQHAPAQTSKGSSQQSRGSTNTLQPSASAVLNASRPTWSSSKNPLKRTASQAMGGFLSTDTGKDINREASLTRDDSMLRRKNDPITAHSLNGGGRVGKLHDTVVFDENDFVDDDELDLDSDTSVNPHTTATNITYPTLPAVPQSCSSTATTLIPPGSSVPIPWSSSPIHHKVPTAGKGPNATTTSLPKSSATQANTSKRRTLPWIEVGNTGQKSDEQDEHQASEAETRPVQRGPAAKVRKILEAQQKRKASGNKVSGEAFTPLPKDKPDSLYPWNKTASAVKQEQKVLRQGNKKLVKDVEATEAAKVTTTKDKKVPRVFLSDEQRKVLNLVADSKKSVFFTGSAGTGKSVLLREVIRVLREKYKREIDRVAVTASTGLAACNVGGVTLHSFAGIGLGKEAVPELVKKIKRNQKAKLRWQRTKVLIIDEISMVDGDLFDKLEGIARIIRNNGRPFGGIQLVITGDFFQLPPVPDYGRIAKFAFDAGTWNTSIEHTIGLTQVFRQKDPGILQHSECEAPCANQCIVFANMLNEMRLGRLTNESINAFKKLNRGLQFEDDFQATELYDLGLQN